MYKRSTWEVSKNQEEPICLQCGPESLWNSHLVARVSLALWRCAWPYVCAVKPRNRRVSTAAFAAPCCAGFGEGAAADWLVGPTIEETAEWSNQRKAWSIEEVGL